MLFHHVEGLRGMDCVYRVRDGYVVHNSKIAWGVINI